MAIPEKIRQLEEQIRGSVEQAVDGLRGGLRERVDHYYQQLVQTLDEARTDLPPAFLSEDDFSTVIGRAVEEAVAEAGTQARLSAGRGTQALRDGLAAIDAARGQAAVLQALQEASAPFADRSAVFLLRDDRLHGWGAHGFGTAENADGDTGSAASVSFSAADGVDWAKILTDGGVSRLASSARLALASRFEAPVAGDSVAVPMILRDRPAAYLFAERIDADGDEDLDVAALQSLTYAAALAIETLPFRTRETTATLAPPADPAASEPEPIEIPPAASDDQAASDDEVETVTPAATVAPVATDEMDLPGGETTATADSTEPADDSFELDPAVEDYEEAAETQQDPALDDYAVGDALVTEEVAEEVTEPAVDEPETTVASDGWSLETTEPEPADPLPEITPEPTVDAVEPEPAAFGTVERDVPDLSHAEPPSFGTIERDVPDIRAAAAEDVPTEVEIAPVEAEPVETEPATPEAPAETTPQPVVSGGPVEPPQDVEGPGWAFSAPLKEERTDDENASHEEARRLARLLVSEIKLYNEDEVLKGRRHNDVFERLRDDIERSRQHYEEQVDAGVRETTDYFYQEMVRLLGAGDPKTLGI